MIPMTQFRLNKNKGAIRLGGAYYHLSYGPGDLLSLRNEYGIKEHSPKLLFKVYEKGRLNPESLRLLAIYVFVGSRKDHTLPLETVEGLVEDELRSRPAALGEIAKAVGKALDRCRVELDARFSGTGERK